MHWPAPLQVQEDPDGGITRLISRAPRQPSGSSCAKQNTVPLEAVSPGAASSQKVLQRLKVNAEEIVDGERRVVKKSVSGVCVKLEPPQKRQTCYHCRYQIICALIGPVEGRQDGVRIITHVPLTPKQCSQLALPNHVARKIKCGRNRGAVLRAISPRRQPTYDHTLATNKSARGSPRAAAMEPQRQRKKTTKFMIGQKRRHLCFDDVGVGRRADVQNPFVQRTRVGCSFYTLFRECCQHACPS